MKKQNLLKAIDQELLDKLFGFCYVRTRDSYEAQELCSDIALALVEAAHSEGEIQDLYGFIWRVARNVYADFSEKKRRNSDRYSYEELGDVAEEAFAEENDDAESLQQIYRSIAFLTRAYREVMIAYYLDGLPIAQIARQQNTSENAIRQRLFSARQLIRNEVKNMESTKKPLALEKLPRFIIWGNGDPAGNDPRSVCTRKMSNHILWACLEKPKTAKEISDELYVPMPYVEDELDILARGENGTYGMVRKLENGKYALNFPLLSQQQIESLWGIISGKLPLIQEGALRFVEAHKEEYLSFPYINRKVDLNLILWQQVKWLAASFEWKVEEILAEKHFCDIKKSDRPFSVFGYLNNGELAQRGYGYDGIEAINLCGYQAIHAGNIYGNRLRPHFHCGLDLARDQKFQLAIRAIYGLPVGDLAEQQREYAAKAVEEGYLFREGDTLYTKFLVYEGTNHTQDRAVSFRFGDEMTAEAEQVAAEIAAFIRKNLPAHLLEDYWLVNELASLTVADTLIDALIEKGLMTPPENGIGAEGVSMNVSK
ncbi:MAG: sigma-70 family RNA polymerase sigma factor [Oscillospiraceae bacterium]|nr:sigma-70 family RNA polymerase sigma factor [Oscillospiraceae bacterium]